MTSVLKRKSAVFLFAFALALTVSLQARAAGVAPASRTATVNGVKLRYLVAGKGSPVILLHGFAETSLMWRPLIAKLAATHTVIAPDLRGTGGSEKPEGGYDKKTLAQDVHALAASLGLRRVKVVGHDIGLMVAYAYAAQYPDEVESIVLMDAFLPGVGDWKTVWLLRDLWHFHFYGETPLKLVTGRERIYLDHFWNDFAADRKHSIPETDRQAYAKAFAQPGAVRAGFEYFKAFSQDATDFERFAKTPLQMPMLVLTGEKASGNFLIEQAKLVDSHVQGIVVAGSGHWLMEEAPGQVIPRLVAFLNGDAPQATGTK
jgi:pimeloyl-ACP methyl ester carboxylesterase